MAERRYMDAETERLAADARREKNWKRWGPYLAERQWGTVREDYSPDGSCWDYFPHDHARSRAYRWGEDGLLGITDRECRLCFALALWNGRDPILKERLFGLTNTEGNHGEDVKECYFYLDATPTSSYLKALYKYPQAEFPYARLVEENRRRSRKEPEFELLDTGIFDDNRYFDVFVEYAKSSPNDILIRITAANRGPEAATLHLLPTVWFRNTWSWGCLHEGCTPKPELRQAGEGAVLCEHATLGRFHFRAGPDRDGRVPRAAVHRQRNEQRTALPGPQRRPVRQGRLSRLRHPRAVGGRQSGGNRHESRGALRAEHRRAGCGDRRLAALRRGRGPARAFRAGLRPRVCRPDQRSGRVLSRAASRPAQSDEDRRISRQAYAGLLWSKQFYHYVVKEWLDGDPGPAAAAGKPPARAQPRLGPPVQSRRDLHARQVGVSLVCRLGLGLSHDPDGRDRSRISPRSN